MPGRLLAVIILDIGRLGDTFHRIMRFVKFGLGETAGIGGNQRNVPFHGQRDQARFGRHFDRVFPARQFDIEASREILLQQGQISVRFALLFFRNEAGQSPFPATGQSDQPGAVVPQKIHPDMGFQLAGPVEMRGGHELAEIFISLGVLRKERKPVENRPRRIGGARARNSQEASGNGLNAMGPAPVIKRHRGKQANPVAQRNRRKAAFFCRRPDRCRLHRAVQYRIGRKGAKMDEGCLGHGVRLAHQSGFAYAAMSGMGTIDHLSTGYLSRAAMAPT